MSVIGTLVSDNLSTDRGIPLAMIVALSVMSLAMLLATWHRVEGTLSLDSVRTPRREVFYWAAVLIAFVLGTSGDDLVAGRLRIGYGPAVLLYAFAIALIAGFGPLIGPERTGVFWSAYVLTRPLGAAVGGWLSQPVTDDGLGLGVRATSAGIILVILILVSRLTVTRREAARAEAPDMRRHARF